MASTVDLRTYLLLERAFVRRLQRSWRQHSAPIYAKITKACLDHNWNEARRLVPELDMAEVGTTNREWIQYMLLSCAVFGANTVAKAKPSFVGVGSFDTFLKQTTNNMLQYLEYTATARVQKEALQLIATDEAEATRKVAFDPSQPRDEKGRWSQTGSTAFKTWFGESKVVDDDGKPLVVYHGTTFNIEQFREAGAEGLNPESDWGAGIYFTSSPDDASENYAGEGPDLTNRIEQEVERLQGMDEELSREAALAQVRKTLVGTAQATVVPVFLSLQKPFVLGEPNGSSEVKETRLEKEYQVQRSGRSRQ